MKNILRALLALVVGVVLGASVNMALVVAGPSVIPPPPGMDMGDAKSLAANAHLLEARHFVFPFLAHAVGTLAGAIAAFLIAGRHGVVVAYVIGVVFLAGGIAASFMIPAPAWFIALDLLVAYLPMAWLATTIGGRLKARAAAAPAR
jgi:hypothetical protein